MSTTPTKSAIVTGGGSGIGASVALDLSQSGYRITIADLDDAGANKIIAQINNEGGVAQFIRTDVSQESDVIALVEAAVSSYGKLDAACNAAGIPQRGKVLHELSADEWDRCLDINLRGLFLCNKYQLIAMVEAGGGSIVNVASTCSMVAVQNAAEYCASKAGVLGLVRGIALDYATKGIRINAVLPGGTKTPMLTSAVETDPTLEAALVAVHPMNRFCEPGEVGSAIKWLLSDEASFVTGASLAVDGGMLAI
ncbi:SDR family NAD(P)-dependent oxidoreductase [Aurantiacibacter zhengii]|uniref:SDR family oxidoreductase n=1 Tax=Aurantiacibacter zhengii TaxID=2307003 RepID=A0A418NUY1_9SPHN|nr:glucose 1-dehydrogenase [Aurantiacibacter zhengii]RIV87967.1 SDR family oxidoreductase [Aurantiacibacter zhengii]